MTEFQREIKRKKRVIEYAEKNGNIKTSDATVYRVCKRHGLIRTITPHT